MSLVGAIEKALVTAEKLKSAGGNEANTKALLIEPLLAAIGWDTTDVDQVEREVPVYDGTKLDYALKVGGAKRLFLEAKALAKQLDDKAFISQTINYANNEGVLWCVLTNGLSYRVYKTNEPVGMEEKLLFEVDLREAANGPASEVAKSLELISRDALINGALEAWGDQVFTDKRVREALISLAKKPPPALVAALEKAIGKPAVTPDRLQESLGRILDVGEGEPLPPKKTSPGAASPPKQPPGPKKEFSLDHHLAGKPAAMVDLFEQVDEFGRSLGQDVSRRIRKFYVGYYNGKRSFFTVEVQRQRLIVYLNLDPTKTSPWSEDSMRDVREIGHYGMGDTELSLRSPNQLDEAKQLIKVAYDVTQ
jgi:predicted transport protein